MNSRVIAGLILVVIGAVIIFRGLTYKSDEGGVQVGDFKATVETRKAVPPWVGAVAIVGGLVLMVGARRGRVI